MVYCGKASLGCQNCRVRRIKCDKLRPDCTQCVRVHKKCPGYRDQLSLMFRDESDKVIQKAHAQWGVPEGSVGPVGPVGPRGTVDTGPSNSWQVAMQPASLATSPPAMVSPHSQTLSRQTLVGRGATVPRRHPSTTACAESPSLATIDPLPREQGINFFLQHYLVGHPDEPIDMQHLKNVKWLHRPHASEMMAATGLTSLANLTGDKELAREARHSYGMALEHTAKAIRTVGSVDGGRDFDHDALMRSVVMLAMFELVRGNQEPGTCARTHIMGAAAVAKSISPWTDATEGFRGILLLCFSMVPSVLCSMLQRSREPNVLIPVQFAPSHMAGIGLPDAFFEMITTAEQIAPNSVDQPAVELVLMVTRFVQLAILVRRHKLLDGKPKTANAIREVMEIDAHLDAWECRQLPASDGSRTGWWSFSVEGDNEECRRDPFPPTAVFRGRYHTYSSMWTARVWNHYRWARVLANQMLIEAATHFPVTAAALGAADTQTQARAMATAQRMSLDILTSIPTHWRHPALSRTQRRRIARTEGGAGLGAAGLPTLMHHVKSAACAPGVPREHWAWGLAILDNIWRDTGMLQAKALTELVRMHRETPPPPITFVDETPVKKEPGPSTRNW